NLLLLAAVFAAFARSQFRLDFESFALQPARDRILAISRLLASQLLDADTAARNRILAELSSQHGFQFTVFENQGRQLAGPGIELPREVRDAMGRGLNVTERGRPAAAPAPPPGPVPILHMFM